MDHIQKQLAQIKQKLSSLQERVSDMEGKSSAKADVKASEHAENKGTPSQAHNNNSNGAGAQVSEEAKSGDHQGIFAAITAFLSGKDKNKSANKQKKGEQSRIQLNISGKIKTGNNVTVTATQKGEAVANAEVRVNGEFQGKTDADGKITVKVPDQNDFKVKAEKEDSKADFKTDIDTSINASASPNSETRTEDREASSNTEASAGATVNRE